MKSLQARHAPLADTGYQLTVLSQAEVAGAHWPLFAHKLRETGLLPLRPTSLEVMQINVGKMCNQTCRHCHVDAGPDRTEIMTRATMQLCLDALAQTNIPVVDLTGGAPEMNPDFRWLVEQISALGRQVIVRCNLTIIVANPKYHDLPTFFAWHGVRVVSSLPHFSASRTDAQRGEGVFGRSIRALQMLNEAGYGVAGSGLVLDLVFNPSGAFLPGSQVGLERDFKQRLLREHGVVFNSLLTITNLPVSRFLEYLLESGNYDGYMQKLVDAYNPAAAANVMCRSTLSIGWDGLLYDCDFNQMLDLPVEARAPQHIRDFNEAALTDRAIVVNQHCYGCTAGAGSSCGGATT
ncbi:arsenosugar biosynthesis radical SAM (seleno)protein ArsS [Hymenobacter psychrotolerans]|uniref:Radical SAM/Cys-rich domain-containing protein n=1 Tax=Hymenobacter psychrotolerans DSM 18569 TaxID=1121959 RepID=A0A1M6T3Y5_9BACT|nr:arsenosugar biosynthesis radical SAM (seleno)protein ArsS [Hymenobacter psychrotolerans]SHK51599.1 radical SAM/Cys-rich domain-containing protein [Hymenobacter psychrotolerans DSM 18569]